MVYAKNVLITADWLPEMTYGGDVALVEVNEDPNLYGQGHIPGAVTLDWRKDLQNPLTRDIVTKDRIEGLLSERGIGNLTTIVLYGDKSNWFATHAYWCLKMYGHQDVRILDGGRQKYIEDGDPMTTDLPSRPAQVYVAPERDETTRAFRHHVEAWIGMPYHTLVDVRSPQEYSGALAAPPGYELEGASRNGHIPTAQSVPWAQAVYDDGTFKSADELAEIYAEKGVTPDKKVTTYCRIGERSAHTWFVLHELLGYPDVRNYDGSWTEWGNLVGAPIER